jgi:hypothetical protein
MRYLFICLVIWTTPAYAATIEARHFRLDLPESFTHESDNEQPARDRVVVIARAGEKQILMLEYYDKEVAKLNFDNAIAHANREAEERGGPFEGRKFQNQACDVSCRAYYREGVSEEGNMRPANIYQYYVEGRNVSVLMAYIDGANDRSISHAQMADFIEQIKLGGL